MLVHCHLRWRCRISGPFVMAPRGRDRSRDQRSIEYPRPWVKADQRGNPDAMMMHGGNGMWSAWVLMPVAMVVFGAMIIAAVIPSPCAT